MRCHPNDPSLPLPKNRHELKARILQGPYQPILSLYPKTKIGNQYRSFQVQYFQKYKWIEFSEKENAAYCFPCRFFKSNNLNNGQLEQSFSTKGFKNWANATKLLNKHQLSNAHITSASSLSHYISGKPIDEVLDNAKKENLKQCEANRIQNRTYLARIIDLTIVLGKCGQAFRGHNEKEGSNNRGLFLELVSLLKKYDSVMSNHLEKGPRNASYTSNRTQNDIIQSIHNVMLRKISSMLKNKYVSIIADETSDCGHHEQMSIVVRFFDTSLNKPVEYFMGLQRLLKVDSQSIFEALNNFVENIGISWENVISVCFDGAANMSGCHNGVQMKCKEKNENIFYVHCYAHCLNLVLVDSIGRKNVVLFDFFGTVQLIYSFLEGSCTRHAVLEKFATKINIKLCSLKSLSTTRWACRHEAVSAVKSNYSALILALEEIYKETTVSEARAKARGILMQMKSFDFIFSLNMMHSILMIIVKVSSSLQSKSINLLTAVSLVTSLKANIQKFRSEDELFNNIYQDTVQLCSQNNIIIPEVRKRKISCFLDDNKTQTFHQTKEHEIKINCYYVALDDMINGLNTRFSQETLGIISAVGNTLQLIPTENDIQLLQEKLKVNSDCFKTEIKLLKELPDTPEKTSSESIENWIEWLLKLDRLNIFTNFFDILKTFLVIPVTSCSSERSFSKLALVKSKLRNTMKQDRLDSLLLLFVEQDLLTKIDYNDVIEEFKILVPGERRLPL